MTLEIIADQTTPHDFGAIVTGLNVIDASEDDIQAVKAAMDRYAVLIFPDQQLTDEQQFAFSRKFGTMENATGEGIGSINPLFLQINKYQPAEKPHHFL